MNQVIFIFEIIGTIAFAVSGAIVALKHQLDLFGVVALGVITATFGGIFRDLILGNTPPAAFTDPIYVFLAAGVSLLVFIVAYTQIHSYERMNSTKFQFLLLIMDSMGLGIFTAVGVSLAWEFSGGNHFLSVFSGMVTGVGGGLLRDIIVVELPDIFQKHIYALASWIGAEGCALMIGEGFRQTGIWIGTLIIVLIRFFSITLPMVTTESSYAG